MKIALHSLPLALLLACTSSAPEPAETWKREALALQKEFANHDPNPWDNTPAKVADLLEKPDPPAAIGPELNILPAGDAAIAWPAPKEGVLTVRYRIERKDCSPAGSDMGCHLAALCPVETPPGAAPMAERIDSEYVGEQGSADVTVEKIELPSPRCELRLYARDHHASQLCTARGPKLPASWSGAAVFDAGTIVLDKVRCERDVLADRMMFRRDLTLFWERRNAGKR